MLMGASPAPATIILQQHQQVRIELIARSQSHRQSSRHSCQRVAPGAGVVQLVGAALATASRDILSSIFLGDEKQS